MNKHDEHCKKIAERLEAVAAGNMLQCPHCLDFVNQLELEEVQRCQCPECGEEVAAGAKECPHCLEQMEPEDMDCLDWCQCPECGEWIQTEDWRSDGYAETATVADWLGDDIYDEKYIISRSGRGWTLDGVRVMVACGGPNIYVDTLDGEVQLYWWNEHGSWPLDTYTGSVINNCYVEVLECQGLDVER